MGEWLKQSTAYTFRLGPFVDATDGFTPETGLTVGDTDIYISKAGGALAAKNDTTDGAHDAQGYYSCVLNTTDTGTLGTLFVTCYVSGARTVTKEFMVVPAAVYDSLVSGSDVLPVDLTQIDGLATSGNNATLKLKSLDIRSNDPAVNALDVRGATGTTQGGNAVYVKGGNSDYAAGSYGGHGLLLEAGYSGSTGGSARGYAVRIVGGGTPFFGCVHIEGTYGSTPLSLIGDSYTNGMVVSGGYGWDGGIQANIRGSIGSLGTQAKADVNAEVKDVMETDTQAEPTSVPAATASLASKIGWLFMRLRNKQTLAKSSGIETVYADNSTDVVGTSTDTDDGSTFTKGKMS